MGKVGEFTVILFFLMDAPKNSRTVQKMLEKLKVGKAVKVLLL